MIRKIITSWIVESQQEITWFFKCIGIDGCGLYHIIIFSQLMKPANQMITFRSSSIPPKLDDQLTREPVILSNIRFTIDHGQWNKSWLAETCLLIQEWKVKSLTASNNALMKATTTAAPSSRKSGILNSPTYWLFTWKTTTSRLWRRLTGSGCLESATSDYVSLYLIRQQPNHLREDRAKGELARLKLYSLW